MPDIVKRVQYFYTKVPDKPGEGARIVSMLKDAGVNLLAYSGFPKGRRARLDFIPADVAAFRTATRKAKLTLVGPKTGFLIQGEDRPGVLAEIIAKLAAAKINVTACDAVAAGEGHYGAILWVKPQDVQKAARSGRKIWTRSATPRCQYRRRLCCRIVFPHAWRSADFSRCC